MYIFLLKPSLPSKNALINRSGGHVEVQKLDPICWPFSLLFISTHISPKVQLLASQIIRLVQVCFRSSIWQGKWSSMSNDRAGQMIKQVKWSSRSNGQGGQPVEQVKWSRRSNDQVGQMVKQVKWSSWSKYLEGKRV